MRRFVRHPSDIPIDIRVAEVQPEPVQTEESRACHMTNVSQGGLSCEVETELCIGCTVDIDIGSISPSYHGTGEVVWCERKGNHYEVGVCFMDRDEAFKSRMVQQVCQIEHYKNLVFEREGRLLNGNQAAAEWIEKYAEDFTK